MKLNKIELTDKELDVVIHALYRLHKDSKNAMKRLRLAKVKDFSKSGKDKLKEYSRTGNRLYKKLKSK
jgi:hypothetical protein